MSHMSDAMIDTLTLPAKIVLPFVVMIVTSLVTPRNSVEALDRYYIKMRTPVHPDAATDAEHLAQTFESPDTYAQPLLFPGTDWEFRRPTTADVVGFAISLVLCFGVIGTTWLITTL